MAAILVVDDEAALRRGIERYLASRGWQVFGAATVAEARTVLEREKDVEIVLADVRLPDGSGLEIADRPRVIPVVVMTGEGSLDTAIAAIQRRVADFLLKPFSFAALEEALERALRPASLSSLPPDSGSSVATWREKHAPGLRGNSPALLRVFSILQRVADTDCTVLVTGESGTGKELVARAIHGASSRRDGPFVTVHCAALPENLIESELFGHARGAFTGAVTATEGRFRAADGGTLFLDEIGELPLPLQAKLLRALQEREVTPVGESRAYRVDVRVVAATNRDLEDMVRSGVFRADLLYRLAVIPVELPPLRERREDIPELVHWFIARANRRRNRRIEGITPEALDALCRADWPGNVRQLENLVERMVVLRSEGVLGLEDLPPRLVGSPNPTTALGPTFARPSLPPDGIDLREEVERFERALVEQALERTGGNRNRAAALLRIGRTTLVEKLRKWRMARADLDAEADDAAATGAHPDDDAPR
ncbi:MAG: sigma-54 dependent transcriptional regulator [Myxococcota bacterium]|nr:sigma-54 dependent transcriptional regulator [Myxococcota bacterium]MDW8363652.1 sigma-54 dependent transcriptional regulator [Myxococcales bacterium]